MSVRSCSEGKEEKREKEKVQVLQPTRALPVAHACRDLLGLAAGLLLAALVLGFCGFLAVTSLVVRVEQLGFVGGPLGGWALLEWVRLLGFANNVAGLVNVEQEQIAALLRLADPATAPRQWASVPGFEALSVPAPRSPSGQRWLTELWAQLCARCGRLAAVQAVSTLSVEDVLVLLREDAPGSPRGTAASARSTEPSRTQPG